MSEHAVAETEINEAQLQQLEEAEEREFLTEIGYREDAAQEQTEEDVAVTVDFLLEKRRKLEDAIARNAEVAFRRIQMIENWRGEEQAVLERQVEWLDRRIRDRAFAFRLGEDGNKKSRRLPNGKVGFRATRDTVEIEDMELVVSFAESHDIPVEKSVLKTPLIEFAQSAPEEPNPETAGFRFVPGDPKGNFYISTEK